MKHSTVCRTNCIQMWIHQKAKPAFQNAFALWLTIFLVSASTAKSASLADFTFEFKSIGSLSGRVAINVPRPCGDGFLEAQVILDVGRIAEPDELARKIKSISVDNISVWVLTSGNKALPFIKVLPPIGVGNAGSGDAHISFRFSLTNQEKPIALVVKIYDELRVFSMPAKQE